MRNAIGYTLIIGITILTATVEIIGSNATNSNGLLADALHLLGDSIPFVLGLSLVAGSMIPRKEKIEELAESLIILFNAIFLAGAALYLGYRGMYRLYHPVEIESTMLWFALFGLAGNAAQLYFAWGLKHAHHHIGTYRSQVLHLAADLAGSVAVVLAGCIVMTTGYVRADSIASLIVAVITAGAAWQCYKEFRYVD
jgi:cobalt-zinc-cadmium efflux system protein